MEINGGKACWENWNWTLKKLGYANIEIKRASEFSISSDSTERIVEICENVGGSNLIYGEGGSRSCHDHNRLISNGINIIQQDFLKNHPIYKQFNKSFFPNLSIIDCLFHCGFDYTGKILKNSWCVY